MVMKRILIVFVSLFLSSTINANEDYKLIEENYRAWIAPGAWGGSYEDPVTAATAGCNSWKEHWESQNREFSDCDPTHLQPRPYVNGDYIISYKRGVYANLPNPKVSSEFIVNLVRECTQQPFLIKADIDQDTIPDVCLEPPKCESENPEDGNPVNCSTGQKIQRDLIYAGVGPDALQFSTSYSSPIYKEEDLLGKFNSDLGTQRNNNYSKTLKTIYTKGSGRIVKLSWGGGYYRIYATTNGTSKLYAPGTTNSDRYGHILNSNSSYVTKSGKTIQFDSNGNITSEVDAKGWTKSYTYTATNKIKSITNNFGSKLEFFYNSQDQLEKLVSPAGEEYLFEFDSLNNMTKIIFPDDTPSNSQDNPFVQYLFEDSRFPTSLTGKINEKGVRFASWTYDQNGRAISSSHFADIEKTEFDYNVANETTVKTYLNNSLYNEKKYVFETDSAGRKKNTRLELAACTDCTNGNFEYEYDGVGKVTKATSPSGTVTAYEYNSKSQLTKRTEGVGTSEERSFVTNWVSGKNLVSNTTEGNLKTTYGYSLDQVYYVTKQDTSSGQSRTTVNLYNGSRLLYRVMGPRTDLTDNTNFFYDGSGNLTKVTNQLGHSTLFENFDGNGRAGKITDANGTITTLTYTPRGWLKSSTTNGALTQYDYYPTGSVKSITSPSGYVINYEYDNGERLTAVVDNLGNRMEYTLDLMGNITETKIKDPGGLIKSSQSAIFNALGQLTKSLGNNGQSNEQTFDAEGNVKTTKNALNNSHTSSFDALNRLSKTIDPDLGETSYTYNSQDLITSVKDAEGKETKYEYNAFGELTKLISPDTGTTTFTYDKAGNVLTKTDARGETVTFTYDAINRVKTQSYSDSSENIVFTYDSIANGNKGIGRLTSVTDQSGSTSYFYDAFGNVTKETRVIDGKSFVTEYHFDSVGQLTGITYPSGRKLTYGFDAIGRVSSLTSDYQSQVKTLASNIEYLPFGPMKSMTYGNNKVQTQSFDLDYRLTSKDVSGIKTLSYGYDVTNNITSIGDSQSAENNQSFTYDKLSRLLTANSSYGDLSYTYDKVGNRKSKTENSNVDTYNYAADSHRLTSVSGVNAKSMTHDAIGNTLVQGDLSFTYNKQGRMKTASKSGMNASYFYDFRGERNFKQVNGIKTYFIYDLNGQLIAEAKEDGTIEREYIYLNGQRLASVVNGTLYYVHSDHLDTPIALTDEAGAVQWQASYTPFGKATIQVNNIDNNIRFPGQYYDAESGLQYNYFRDYDPEIGRYIQSDPLGLFDGANTYGYVHQNPIMNYDPKGLYCIPCAMAIGAAIGAAIDALLQLAMNGGNIDCIDWKQVGVSGGLGALGGGIGSALSQMRHARQLYQSGLAEALGQNLSARMAHAARRYLGAQLKRMTPFLARQLIYLRNLRLYGDKLGPIFNPAKHSDVLKTLTDTNFIANLILKLPSRGLVPAGASVGAAGNAIRSGAECGCE